MKHLNRLFILSIIASFSLFQQLQSQDFGGGLLGEMFSAKHIVKTNLVGWAFYSINANYEYKAGPNTSVGLLEDIRYLRPSQLMP